MDERMFEQIVDITDSTDAALFMCEWYPEFSDLVDECFTHMSSYGGYKSLALMNDEELAEHLAWYEVDEDGFQERFGYIFQDAAFDGNLVFTLE